MFVGGEGGGALSGGMNRQLVLAPFSRQKFTMMLSLVTTAGLEELREHLVSGSILPHVETAYPLAQAAEAMRHLTSGVRGKLVLIP